MSPLCSRNARSQKTLVGRAQVGLIRAIIGNVHEQAWKGYLWLITAALHGTRRVPGRRVYLGRLRASG